MSITKGYGITVSDIDNSCPSEMMPYQRAFEKSFEYEDEKAWLHGYYTYLAIGVVLSNAFSKKGAKQAEYPKMPRMQEVEQREMTKEEFDALSDEEKERVTIQAFENAMSDTLDGFNKARSAEGEEK